MTRIVIITVPMAPASEVFPNRRHRRGGFHPGIVASAECRMLAMSAARLFAGITIAGPVELTIHAAYGYKRMTPDLDATISAVKPFVDGIVDAGILVDDRQIVKITATHEKLPSSRKIRACGYTELTIREIERTRAA